MANRYGIYCASFTHAGGTLDLQQLDSQDLSSGSSYKSIRPGGALSPAAHILSTANPRARFSTTDILTVLTAMGGNFHLACSGGHVMRYQKRLAGGAFATGGSHFIQSTAKGFLHVVSIDVDIDSDDGARMELEYVPLSVAGENPITDTPSQSLASAPVPAFMSQYFMGGVYLGTDQLLGLRRMSWRPGIRFTDRRSDGGVFSRYDSSSITAYTLMINLQFLNVEIPTTIGTTFLNALGAAIKGYLQRGTTATDGRIAAATTSHIKIAAAAGSWGVDNYSVSGEDDAMSSVGVMPTGTLTPTLGVALAA